MLLLRHQKPVVVQHHLTDRAIVEREPPQQPAAPKLFYVRTALPDIILAQINVL
jgi:hypothetical protein